MGSFIGFNSPTDELEKYDYVTVDPTVSSANTLVAERFVYAQKYADDSFNTAIGLMNDFSNIDIGFDWTPQPPADTEFPPGLEGLSPVDPPVPAINPIEVVRPEFPYSAPNPLWSPIISDPIPGWDVEMPNFFIPAPPDTEVPGFTAQPPPEASITIPGWDGPELPPLPQIKEILPPDELIFNMPTFEGKLPVDDLTPPDLLYSWNEAEYNSDVLEALKIKVRDGIVNGGTGIAPEIEQAIYDRAASRLDVELQKAENLASNDFASKGARLPQGALIGRLQETALQNILAREDLTRDVMIKSADQAYQYSTFIIEKGLALEHEAMTLINNVQQRAFDASKFTIEAAIKIFESKVQAYGIKMEAYKVEAQVFEAKIRAEVAKAELYKSIVEGRKISLEMQGILVDLYSKQVDAVETMAKIYAIRMDGAQTEAQIFGIKIEHFKALVDAYTAQVGGVTAEYNLYQAQIAGESEKAKMYAYQADGYKSRVDAYKVKSDIDINNLQAEIDASKNEIEVFVARLEKYKTDVTASVAEAEIQAKAEGLKLDVFTGQIQKFDAVVKALTESYKARTNVDIANAGVDIQYGEILAKLELGAKELTSTLARAQAQVAGQLASSALSSVSAGANLGYSQSRSDSTSASASTNIGHNYSDSDVNSDSSSSSYNHNYMEKCCE